MPSTQRNPPLRSLRSVAPHGRNIQTALAIDERKGEWHANDRLNGSLKRPRELVAETWNVCPIPSLSVQDLGPGPEAKLNAHQRLR
jgi:hypothetical protein